MGTVINNSREGFWILAIRVLLPQRSTVTHVMGEDRGCVTQLWSYLHREALVTRLRPSNGEYLRLICPDGLLILIDFSVLQIISRFIQTAFYKDAPVLLMLKYGSGLVFYFSVLF